jgi:hypothetical protein
MRGTLSREVADDVAVIADYRGSGRASRAATLRLLAVSAGVAFAITVIGATGWGGSADLADARAQPAPAPAARGRGPARVVRAARDGTVRARLAVDRFPGNTLWDWLHPLLVPFVLPIAVAWFSVRLDPATQNGLGRAVAVSPDAPAEAG